jgi:type IV pilus assembly protein PilN
MPRINLLPWRDQQRRERKLHFFLALGGAVVLSALVAGAAYVMLGVMIDGQEQRNDRLKSQIKLLDQQIEQINDLEAQKQKFISRMQIIEKLQRSRPEVVHLFDEMVKVMPDGTYLTSIKESGNKLKLEGVAQSSTRVSSLMRNIADSQWMKNPELEVVQTKNDAIGSSFTLDAEQISVNNGDDTGAGQPTKRPVRANTGSAGK